MVAASLPADWANAAGAPSSRTSVTTWARSAATRPRRTGFLPGIGASSARRIAPCLDALVEGPLVALLVAVPGEAAGGADTGTDGRAQPGIAGHGANQRAAGGAAQGAGPGAL